MGYHFTDQSLLQKALTHASLHGVGGISYERLEFLGDAVAGVVVAERLFRAPEHWSEGQMTAIKSDAVSRTSMVSAGRRLGLESYMRVDRGLAAGGKKYPDSVVADAFEALVGAVFLDGGMEKAREFVLQFMGLEIQRCEERRHTPNFKSTLQELVQAECGRPPTYRTLQQVGPDHEAQFLAAVHVLGVEKGSGWGTTKKEAEQRAAEAALETHYPNWRGKCRETGP